MKHARPRIPAQIAAVRDRRIWVEHSLADITDAAPALRPTDLFWVMIGLLGA
jgi:hypothetical protein